MKKIISLIFLLFVLLISFNIPSIPAYAEVLTSAKSMVILEKQSNRVLFSKNAEQKLPMASTTKIVTALTVLENCDNLEEIVYVDDRAVGVTGTSIYLRKGERLTVKELLYGMMLVSGNDASTALALHISDNIEDFCDKMQQTAKKAGAFNSSFKNPHGLDEEGHYTTAYDLAIITSKALKNPIFAEIVQTKSISISGNEEVERRYLKNKNRLLNSYAGMTGVKTGFTDDAGRCFVGSAKRENMEIIGVLLNCGPMFEDCERLFDASFQTYNMFEILEPYNYIKRQTVQDGKEESVKVYTRKGFSYPLTLEEYNLLKIEYDVPEILKAPIQKEDIVGQVHIYLDEQLLFSENIYAMEEVRSVNILENIKEIIKNWNVNS